MIVANLIEKVSKVRILVVGDVMLDRYWWGNVSRISPEAPVPVVKLEKTTEVAGGAANVAANIVGLGAEVFLVGVAGEDLDAQILSEKLKQSGINADSIIRCQSRHTTVKSRILAHGQQIVRLDQETINNINEIELDSVFNEIEKIFNQIDVVIISDYAKGFVTEELASRLITKCNSHNKKILVDPKGKNYAKYKNASILTPNLKESADVSGLEISDPETVNYAGKALLSELAADGILITQGEHGMSLFVEDGQIHKFNALARNVYDVTGAGDTVIATLSVMVGAGYSYYEAAEISNIAAGLVVEQLGTTAITINQLKEVLEITINEQQSQNAG